MVSLKSAPWAKYTQYGTIFQKKIMFYYETFFFFKYILYRTVLNNYLNKKKQGHRAYFLTNWRGFEIAVGMENLRSGNWDKTQNKDHRVRSTHPRSSLFSVVFMFDITNTEIHT